MRSKVQCSVMLEMRKMKPLAKQQQLASYPTRLKIWWIMQNQSDWTLGRRRTSSNGKSSVIFSKQLVSLQPLQRILNFANTLKKHIVRKQIAKNTFAKAVKKIHKFIWHHLKQQCAHVTHCTALPRDGLSSSSSRQDEKE